MKRVPLHIWNIDDNEKNSNGGLHNIFCMKYNAYMSNWASKCHPC
jgi:hypothetical protein